MGSPMDWLLAHHAEGHLPRPLRRYIDRKLLSRPGLQRRYNALRSLEHAAHPEAGLSEGQRALIRARLMDSLDQARDDATPGVAGRAVGTHFPLGRPRALPAIAALAGALLVVGWLGSRSEETSLATPSSSTAAAGPAWQTRSVATGTSGTTVSPPLGLRARCVVGDQVRADAAVGARQADQALACAREGMLAFSGTNLDTRDHYVLLLGVTPDQQIVWLPPFHAEASALRMPAQITDQPWQELTPMAALPSPEMVLHVLISPEPFSAPEVERRLAQLERAALPLASLDRLPLNVATQARIQLRREP